MIDRENVRATERLCNVRWLINVVLLSFLGIILSSVVCEITKRQNCEVGCGRLVVIIGSSCR